MDYSLLHKKLPPSFEVFIPFHGFDQELLRELSVKSVRVLYSHPKIILTEKLTDQSAAQPLWSQDWWPECQSVKIDSVKIAVDTLKNQKTMGCYYFIEKSILASQISQRLRLLEVKRIDYKISHPFNFNFFTWTLLGEQLIFCKKPKSRFPFGWHEFNENKSTPPNRAYLKLWELFSVHGIFPNKADSVIEIGASPGGWTWVLSQLSKHVYAIDKAPLAAPMNQTSNITFQAQDAFKLNPKDYETCSWFFSDLICTPEKLYDTIGYWLEKSTIRNFVCTVKFKGDCDYDVLKKFTDIENSQLIHLYQNKNEVTWIKLDKKKGSG